MSIKNEFASYFAGVAKAIAVGTIVGGGTMLLNAHNANAVQDQKIEQLRHDNAALGGAVEKLNTSVQALDKNVAVLNDRMREK